MEPRKSLSCCFVSASIYFLSHNCALKMSISNISNKKPASCVGKNTGHRFHL